MLKNQYKLFFASSIAALLGAGIADCSYAADPAADFSKQMDAYLANDANVEKVGNALERYFTKKQQQQVEAQQKAEQQSMEEQFKNPAKIDIGNAAIKGNPNAKITVVEISDFQCPYCRRGSQVMEEVLKAYPNDVKIAFINYPLPFHDQAKPAAIAALAAKEQGKFWEMHDLLFENQQQLGEEAFIGFAGKLGMNVEKFKTDMKSDKLAKQVDEESKKATALGVQGTPGFFVNGVAVRGARPLPYFKEIIDRWLQILNANQPAEAVPTKKK